MTNKQFAVITGASSGIGLELARNFVKDGFDVLIAAEDMGIFAAADKLKANATVIPIQVDLAAEGGVDKLWEFILKEAGRSMQSRSMPASASAAALWRTTLRVNST